MFVRIPKLLNDQALARIDEILAEAPFIDGKKTAGAQAQKVKNNLQMDRENTPDAKEVEGLIAQAVSRHPLIRTMAMPVRVMAPMIARYEVGMGYGIHSDNPFIGGKAGELRSDLSCSVFLSDPDSYEGGDLVAMTDLGPQKIRLPRGDAVIYPTGTLHEVTAVTSGVRLAAVTWMQSRIADPHKRQILAEMDILIQGISKAMPDSAEQRRSSKIFGDLARLWSVD
ncbi:Fe2+-dependent dioxygenase [Magnetospira sp. QH-2]|uniref:Fe2+-dependent dioxygenase n=1 Tax=Magnetospira sp. (strain QH-2) TaxID=1288970 RepID=UPI0003E815B4|nr:Fe2+-dependent dioxygenase [Magnetospira sp. QH-2]CCQ74867.1 PKHD-type hydroxylase [Magnetospira sp. QH-2]